MKSEEYRIVLNNVFETKEIGKEYFDRILLDFAMTYHKEQLDILNENTFNKEKFGELAIIFLNDLQNKEINCKHNLDINGECLNNFYQWLCKNYS